MEELMTFRCVCQIVMGVAAMSAVSARGVGVVELRARIGSPSAASLVPKRLDVAKGITPSVGNGDLSRAAYEL
jgi:invasion protein IalB